jgi:outer membrane protein insertion porin family
MPLPNLSRTAAVALAAAALLAGAAPAAAAQERPSQAPAPTWADVRVEFEGLRAFPAEQLKSIVRQRAEAKFAPALGQPADLSRARFTSELLEYFLRHYVLDFMRDAGYLRAKFGEVRQEPAGHALLVTVPVEEGEFFRLGDVKVEGARRFTAEQLLAMLPLKRGDVASGPVVVRWLSEHLQQLYGEAGFIQYDYEVEPVFKVEPGAEAGVADLLITINEGRSFVLRGVSFEGVGDVPEESLRAALQLREGEVFSPRKLRDGLGRLDDLELFDRLNEERDVRLSTDEEAGHVEISIRLRERPAGWPPPGGGR